jgi:uncharacterized protein YggE
MAKTRELVVTGEGSAFGIPDRCEITIALNVMADTSAAVLDRVGDLAQRVIGVVLEQGLERPDVQTVNVSLHDWFDKESQRVTARVATYVLSVSVSGLERAGPLLAAVAPVGGDSLQIHGLRLSVGDPRPLIAEARRGAVTDALAKARELAAAAGVHLGRITSIVDGDSAPSGNRSRYWNMSATSAAGIAPVEAGTSSVTAHVTIAMSIED